MIDFTSDKNKIYPKQKIDVAIPQDRFSDNCISEIEFSVLKCSICKNIPSFPIKDVLYCERFFCFSCLENHHQMTKQKTCPACGKNGVFKPPSQCDLIIFSKLKIKCKNKFCEKEFFYFNERNELNEHEENCKYTIMTENPKSNKVVDNIFDNNYPVGSNFFCFECGMISKNTNHSCIKYLCAKMINYERFLKEEIEKIKDGLISLQKEKNTKILSKEDFFDKCEEYIDINKNETNLLLKLNSNLCEKENLFLSHKSKTNSKHKMEDEDLTVSEFGLKKKQKKINESFRTLKANTIQKNKVSSIITTSVFSKISNFVLPYVRRCSNMSLIFKASEFNFSSEKFHLICDGLSPSLTIVKDNEGYIFGGYSTLAWKSKNCGSNYTEKRKNNFLFSIDKERIYPSKTYTNSVNFDISLGPCFGDDLKIVDQCNIKESISKLGKCYKISSEGELNSLTSKNSFKIIEYEVFHLY